MLAGEVDIDRRCGSTSYDIVYDVGRGARRPMSIDIGPCRPMSAHVDMSLKGDVEAACSLSSPAALRVCRQCAPQGGGRAAT